MDERVEKVVHGRSTKQWARFRVQLSDGSWHPLRSGQLRDLRDKAACFVSDEGAFYYIRKDDVRMKIGLAYPVHDEPAATSLRIDCPKVGTAAEQSTSPAAADTSAGTGSDERSRPAAESDSIASDSSLASPAAAGPDTDTPALSSAAPTPSTSANNASAAEKSEQKDGGPCGETSVDKPYSRVSRAVSKLSVPAPPNPGQTVKTDIDLVNKVRSSGDLNRLRLRLEDGTWVLLRAYQREDISTKAPNMFTVKTINGCKQWFYIPFYMEKLLLGVVTNDNMEASVAVGDRKAVQQLDRADAAPAKQNHFVKLPPPETLRWHKTQAQWCVCTCCDSTVPIHLTPVPPLPHHKIDSN